RPMSDGADVQRFRTLPAGADLELHLLAVGERTEAASRDVGEVDEDVVAVGTGDEPETLLVVEELDGASGHDVLSSVSWPVPPDAASSGTLRYAERGPASSLSETALERPVPKTHEDRERRTASPTGASADAKSRVVRRAGTRVHDPGGEPVPAN